PDLLGDAVIAAAGDNACAPGDGDFNDGLGDNGRCFHKYVADTIYSDFDNVDRVLPLGDIQYESGAYSDFLTSYHQSWAKLRSKTSPVLGNHESNGNGYFDYFNGVGMTSGVAGTRGEGWYSFETGDAANTGWHIVALNSECAGEVCNAEQLAWLEAELTTSKKPCTLAYWHKPRFSSGAHGDAVSLAPLWDLIHRYGGEIVLSGHDHNYERFAPQNTAGEVDPAFGVRQFVVGTGGKGFRSINPGPNSEASNADTHGFLELTLQANSYDWRFVPALQNGNGTFTDSGTRACHAQQ
ncbi:MAG: metallophosphoesterase, partial [Actinobacteria bacterium]|nr:metallophosphoesterase [Actinomycetota bacterium]